MIWAAMSSAPQTKTKGRESDAQIDQEERVAAEKKTTEFRVELEKLLVRYEEASINSSLEESSEKATDEHEEAEREAELIGEEEEEEEEEEELCESSQPKENGPTITCPECRRSFRSLKSLYGHLRSHPDRDYRGASKPPALPSKRPGAGKCLIVSHWQTKRARSRFDANEARGSDAEDTKEFDANEIEVAEALLMLRRGIGPVNREAVEVKKVRTNSPLQTRYSCNLCEKSFATHQALGGHVASHNKHKSSLEAEAPDRNDQDDGGSTKAAATTEHKCNNCGKLFESGQALGGHKRRYYNQPRRDTESSAEPSAVPTEGNVEPSAVPSTPSMVPSTVNARSKGLDIDLNEPWKPEDEREI